MALAVLDVYNQAMSHLGANTSIAAVDETSREAEVCTLHYETARDAVFRAAPWNSLTGYSRLAIQAVRDNAEDWVAADPPPGWLWAFALPNDHIRPRFLASYARFELSNIGDVPIIAANEETPILTYTRRQPLVHLWDIDLFQAVTFALSAHCAKGITGNDSDLQNMFSLAQEKILIARANNANINAAPLESNPDWLVARGQSLQSPNAQFIYPSANFTVGGANNLG